MDWTFSASCLTFCAAFTIGSSTACPLIALCMSLGVSFWWMIVSCTFTALRWGSQVRCLSASSALMIFEHGTHMNCLLSDLSILVFGSFLHHRLFIDIALAADDRVWAESCLLRLAEHPDIDVRGNALMAFAQVSSRLGEVDRARVAPVLAAGLQDGAAHVREQAEASLDELGWNRLDEE